MADIWLPGYRRHLFSLRGKPYQFTHNPKGCLHTTEGGSIAGALSAYAPYPPHLIYDWRSREKVQHIPLNLAAYSAMDGSDDDYMVQVELVGFAAESRNWPEQALRNIAEDVLFHIEQASGVPRKAIWHGFKDARDGISPPLASTSSPIRINPTQLRDFSGWLGHQHLPAPDEHWDPGALPIQRIFNYMQEGEDEMSWDTPIPNHYGSEPPAKVMLAYIDENVNDIKAEQAAQRALLAEIANDPDVTLERLTEVVEQAVAAANAAHLAAQKAQLDATLNVVREIVGARDENLADEVVDEISRRTSRAA